MRRNAHNAPEWQCGAQSRHTKQGEAQAEPRTKALPSAAPGADKKRHRAVTDAAFPRPTAYLAVENDVLAAAENGLPAHLVARCLWGEGTIAEPSQAKPSPEPNPSTRTPGPAPHRLDVLGLVVQHLAQLHGRSTSAKPLWTSGTSLPAASRRFRCERGQWRRGCHGHGRRQPWRRRRAARC